jgi:hypothetical protein
VRHVDPPPPSILNRVEVGISAAPAAPSVPFASRSARPSEVLRVSSRSTPAAGSGAVNSKGPNTAVAIVEVGDAVVHSGPSAKKISAVPVDVGVPLMGKATRESLKQRAASTIVNVGL